MTRKTSYNTERANVHIFGNSSSPSVAIFALRHTTANNTVQVSKVTVNLIHRNSYMDNCLGSADSCEVAIGMLEEARNLLNPYNIHLHKIVSSSVKVIKEFPESDRAVDIILLEFDDLSTHSTLGIAWEINSDRFVIKVNVPNRPFTKR